MAGRRDPRFGRAWIWSSALSLAVLSATPVSAATPVRPVIPGIEVPALPETVLARARAERRLALVIGNGAYAADPLSKPPRDARSMAAALEYLGFTVTLVVDGKKRDIDTAVEGFVSALRKEPAFSVFYYSGHGAQIDGENFLPPIDFPADPQRTDFAYDALNLSRLIASMREANPKGSTVIVSDACRANKFVKGIKNVAPGLAPVRLGGDRTEGETVIAMATEPGRLAYEGDGPHSFFTAGILKNIFTPGEDIDGVFKAVRRTVFAATKKEQSPTVEAFGGERSPRLAPLACSREEEEEERNKALAVRNVPAYLAFAERCSDSPWANWAKKEAAELEARRLRLAGETFPPAPEPSPAPVNPSPSAGDVGRVFRDRFIDGSGEAPELVVLPSRTFQMGSTKETDGDERYDNEGPRHEVRIGPGLAVGKNAVTVGEYGVFVKATGRKTEGGCHTWTGTEWKSDASANWTKPGFPQTDRHPVVCVSWEDATAYAEWLSKRTGLGYRLLSESEYEYGARGGTTTRRYWGDDASHEKQCGYANGADQSYGKRFPQDGDINKKCSDGQIYTSPVGTFSPNDFKLHDMLGNVWQWTSDCWHESYDKPSPAPTDGSAWTSACAENRRVARGGSWDYVPGPLRAALRVRFAPDYRDNIVGFRVARTITP